jgi:hypothetical protein
MKAYFRYLIIRDATKSAYSGGCGQAIPFDGSVVLTWFR